MADSKTDNEEEQNEKSAMGSVFNLRIGNAFYERLTQHLFMLGKMKEEKTTKQDWVEDAIRSKLEREKDLSPEDIGKDKRLGFRMPEALRRAVDKQVELLKHFRQTYSSRLWILEAVTEKLHREEHTVWRWLENLRGSLSDDSEASSTEEG